MQIDAYKARKEPIPFGMSEKIWDLDSYKDNYKKFYAEFERIQKDYNEGEERLKELKANPGLALQDNNNFDKRALMAGSSTIIHPSTLAARN